MPARIMRGHGEFCHRCHCEIQIGERWYRYDGVRCTETRKIYHSDFEICNKNLYPVKSIKTGGESSET